MSASPGAEKDKLALQRKDRKIVNAFSRKITVCEGVVESCTRYLPSPLSSGRVWIPSSISLADHLHRLHLNQTRHCDELKNLHLQ
jgi:hypothetical protein